MCLNLFRVFTATVLVTVINLGTFTTAKYHSLKHHSIPNINLWQRNAQYSNRTDNSLDWFNFYSIIVCSFFWSCFMLKLMINIQIYIYISIFSHCSTLMCFYLFIAVVRVTRFLSWYTKKFIYIYIYYLICNKVSFDFSEVHEIHSHSSYIFYAFFLLNSGNLDVVMTFLHFWQPPTEILFDKFFFTLTNRSIGKSKKTGQGINGNSENVPLNEQAFICCRKKPTCHILWAFHSHVYCPVLPWLKKRIYVSQNLFLAL